MTQVVRLEEAGAPALPAGVADSLRAGRVAVVPTDTLYGMAADPVSGEGLARLLAVKGREAGKPVPLLLDGRATALSLASRVPAPAARLMERFWPGALTLVLPASPAVPDAVTGGTGTVGLRVPDHPVPRALAAEVGGAITGTSANRAGRPGIWTTPEEIAAEFGDGVDWIVWDGPLPLPRGQGLGPAPGSTVVLVSGEGVELLREGAIPFRTITDFLGKG